MVTGAWPLVGRNAELAQIAAARADERCPAVVISAAAGVGKSRLAREACIAAEVDGPPSLWAQATASSATIPLGALAALIPDEVRSDDPLELVRRSVAALRERAGGRTVLLAVDMIGTMRMCRAVILYMRRHGHGAIINFSSTYGNGVNPEHAINWVPVT